MKLAMFENITRQVRNDAKLRFTPARYDHNDGKQWLTQKQNTPSRIPLVTVQNHFSVPFRHML